MDIEITLNQAQASLVRDVLREAIDSWSGIGEENEAVDAHIQIAWSVLERLGDE